MRHGGEGMLFAVTALLLSPVPVAPAADVLPMVPPGTEWGIAHALSASASSAAATDFSIGSDTTDAGFTLAETTVSPSSVTGAAVDFTRDTAARRIQPPAPAAASTTDPAGLGPLSREVTAGAASAGGSALTAAALLGPVVAAEPATLPQLSGVTLLRQLAVQPRSELARFFAGNADSVRSLLASPPSPTTVRAWWASVPPAWKHTISTAAPGLVGNLNGIPFAERSSANRSLLTESLVQLESQLDADVGRAQLGETIRRADALRDISGALGDANSEPQRFLLSLDLEREPTAAIAVGDPQQADYVSFLIPGMFFNSGAQISEWTDTAARLYDEQISWLQLLREEVGDDTDDPLGTVAAVAWVGYQTPHLLNVGSLDLAKQGRDSLTGMIAGLQASRGVDQPYLSILAHSYGSTAALMALEENDFMVDALAVIGSPGSAAQSVEELNVRNGNVFVGEAAWDPIPNSSYFGSDPGAESYGATPMKVGGGIDVITNEVLAASTGHNEYFGPGTESLRNLALIAIDQGALVTDGTEKDQERTVAFALQHPAG
jgi:hypothetical protein